MNIDSSEVTIDILDIKHFASVKHFASNIDIGNYIAERGFNDNFLNSSIAEEHFAICMDIVNSIFHFIEVTFYIDILDLIFHIFEHIVFNNDFYIYIDIFRHIFCHHFFHSILYQNNFMYSCSCMHQSTLPSIPTVTTITIVIINILQNDPLDITSYIDYSSIVAIIIIIIIIVIINITFEEFIYNSYGRIVINIITFNIIINIVIHDIVYNHINEVHYYNISIIITNKGIRRIIHINIIKMDIYINNSIITETTYTNINGIKINIYKVNIILYYIILIQVIFNFNILLYLGIVTIEHFINNFYTSIIDIRNLEKISYGIFNVSIINYSYINIHLAFNTIINHICLYFSMVSKVNNKNNNINFISDIFTPTTLTIYFYVFNNEINLISFIFSSLIQNLIYIDFFHNFINHLYLVNFITHCAYVILSFGIIFNITYLKIHTHIEYSINSFENSKTINHTIIYDFNIAINNSSPSIKTSEGYKTIGDTTIITYMDTRKTSYQHIKASVLYDTIGDSGTFGYLSIIIDECFRASGDTHH